MEHQGMHQFNAHTIPDVQNFDYVLAAVTRYFQLATIPTYTDLVQRQRAYTEWFHSVSAPEGRTGPSIAMGRPTVKDSRRSGISKGSRSRG